MIKIDFQSLYENNARINFRELFEHKDPQFNDNNTVTAMLHHPLQYIPEMSNGTEEDLLILPNIALLVSETNLAQVGISLKDQDFSRNSWKRIFFSNSINMYAH